MIYIHSKCMIVDDSIALIGSANINDRSLDGSRDSEIAIVIEDQAEVESFMDKQPFQAKKLAFNLRTQLYREHFGINDQMDKIDCDVQDPLNDNLIQRINKIVQTNTEIYRQIFRCYPDDQVEDLTQLEDFKKK